MSEICQGTREDEAGCRGCRQVGLCDYHEGHRDGYTAGAQAEREQCIKDVCQACYLEYEPILDERTGHWYHRRESGDDTLCWASPIRRRVEKGE